MFTSVNAPVTAPAVVGAKLTVTVAVLPAATVNGEERPESPKPVPDSAALLIVRLPVPGFEIVTVCVLVTPVVTLPKFTEAGVTEICGVCAAVPVPERATLTDGVAELFTRVSVPAKVPVVVGAKVTVNAEDDPAGIVSGSVTGGSLKPVPDTLAEVIVRLAVPELEIVTV